MFIFILTVFHFVTRLKAFVTFSDGVLSSFFLAEPAYVPNLLAIITFSCVFPSRAAAILISSSVIVGIFSRSPSGPWSPFRMRSFSGIRSFSWTRFISWIGFSFWIWFFAGIRFSSRVRSFAWIWFFPGIWPFIWNWSFSLIRFFSRIGPFSRMRSFARARPSVRIRSFSRIRSFPIDWSFSRIWSFFRSGPWPFWFRELYSNIFSTHLCIVSS